MKIGRETGMVLLALAASIALWTDGAAADGQAGNFKTAQFADDAGDGWLLMRCDGEGVDRAAAMQNARESILYTLATTRLAQSAGEKTRLAEKLPALLAETKSLVRAPSSHGGRQGLGGLMRQYKTPDGVAITLMAEVDEAGARKLLAGWGVLDAIARPDGRKFLLLLLPAGKQDSRTIPMAQALLFKRLAHLPVEWLDPPGLKRVKHAANLAAAKKAGADLLIEIATEIKKEGDSVAGQVTIEVIDPKEGRIVATVSQLGMARFAKQGGAILRALQDPITTAVAQLLPQLTQVLKTRAAP